MIVVAVIAILASIAIPQYLDYLNERNKNVCIRNAQVALNLVREEIARTQSGDGVQQDILSLLNRGGKKPYDSTGFGICQQRHKKNARYSSPVWLVIPFLPLARLLLFAATRKILQTLLNSFHSQSR